MNEIFERIGPTYALAIGVLLLAVFIFALKSDSRPKKTLRLRTRWDKDSAEEDGIPVSQSETPAPDVQLKLPRKRRE